MNETIHSQVQKLSFEEKLLLVEEIWDDIALNSGETIQLSHEQKDEIDRRYKKYKKNSENCKSWDETKKGIKNRK